MKCMFCGCEDSKVLDSRAVEENNSIRRRRECLQCGKRFTTYETIESTPIMVVKADSRRMPFDIEKIKIGIVKACYKRPISMARIDEIVMEIEKKIQNSLVQEISTREIGELIMKELKGEDEVAYIRFASVYKQFKDIGTMLEFMKQG